MPSGTLMPADAGSLNEKPDSGHDGISLGSGRAGQAWQPGLGVRSALALRSR
jgi:hypothetical protein